MSYRTSVNGIQIFGNNDYFDPWIDFIKSQGIEVDSEYNYHGYITHDIDEALKIIERIGWMTTKDDDTTLADMLKRYITENDEGLYTAVCRLFETSYTFDAYNFVKACGDAVNIIMRPNENGYVFGIELKEGAKVEVEAG